MHQREEINFAKLFNMRAELLSTKLQKTTKKLQIVSMDYLVKFNDSTLVGMRDARKLFRLFKSVNEYDAIKKLLK